MAMLVLTAEMTTKRMAETTLGTRWRRMIQPKLPPMQREARMYSLWRIWRTSPRTMRARANQPVTPMSRAMLRAFWGPRRETASSSTSSTGMLWTSSTRRMSRASVRAGAMPDRQP